MSANDKLKNEPTFPAPMAITERGEVLTLNDYRHNASGMPLLDYFAGQALAGLVCPPGWIDNSVSPELTGAKRYAAQAYMLADAMIAARNKTKEG